MSRYIAFGGRTFYPMGGMEDYLGHFADLDEAKAIVEGKRFMDWGHILDHVFGQIHKLEGSKWIVDQLSDWTIKD